MLLKHTHYLKYISCFLLFTDSNHVSDIGVDSQGNPFTFDTGLIPGITAPFTTSDLVSWGWQVAQGMEYLSRRKVSFLMLLAGTYIDLCFFLYIKNAVISVLYKHTFFEKKEFFIRLLYIFFRFYMEILQHVISY